MTQSTEKVRERRRDVRIRRRLRVEYGVTALEYKGSSRDISVGGLFLMGERVFKMGTRIHLNVILAEDHFYAEAQVVHSKRVQASLRRIETQGMGIRFLSTSELVRKLVPHSIRRMETLAVHCASPDEVKRLLAEQLKAGVLVVPVSDPPPPLNKVVEFEIQLDWLPGDPARGSGRVIQMLGGGDPDSQQAVLEVQDIVPLIAQLERTR